MIYKLKRNIPNIITISRIVSLILGFVFFIKNKIILSLIFYIYGAVSDALDGYFARKLSAYSKFGQYLDAVSDKLYFLSLIIILLIYKYYLIVIPLIIELIISVINYLILKKNKKVFTERVGKFKTTLLIIDLILGIISIKIKEIMFVQACFSKEKRKQLKCALWETTWPQGYLVWRHMRGLVPLYNYILERNYLK
mgnify:CR=1 FL=1